MWKGTAFGAVPVARRPMALYCLLGTLVAGEGLPLEVDE